MAALAALFADVKRHSLEDGPGIRSVVFFKGCPYRCLFCHNPEMQSPRPEVVYRAGACLGCGACAQACPMGHLEPSGTRSSRSGCRACGRCAEACPSGARRLVGRAYGLEQLVELLLRDEPFYRHSGGGVTVSGGEPTLFPDALEALVRRLRTQGIHLVLQTTGDFDLSWFRERILPLVDQIYFDVKFADPELSLRYAGRANRRALVNLGQLLALDARRIVPRVPLVPGVTATPENLRAIARLLRGRGARSAVLLPYNPLGREKAEDLGQKIPIVPRSFMTEAELGTLCSEFEAYVKGT